MDTIEIPKDPKDTRRHHAMSAGIFVGAGLVIASIAFAGSDKAALQDDDMGLFMAPGAIGGMHDLSLAMSVVANGTATLTTSLSAGSQGRTSRDAAVGDISAVHADNPSFVALDGVSAAIDKLVADGAIRHLPNGPPVV